MTEEWIKKDSVIKAVCSGCLEENNTCRHGWDCPILTNLGRLPFIDRPQGEWIPATWQDEYCPERLKKHKCSVCGHRAETVLVKVELVDNYYCNKAEPIAECTHKEQLSKYCPNCGAKMKGVDNEIFCR